MATLFYDNQKSIVVLLFTEDIFEKDDMIRIGMRHVYLLSLSPNRIENLTQEGNTCAQLFFCHCYVSYSDDGYSIYILDWMAGRR